MYYGKMGWTYQDLYNLPVHLRRYFYLKLSDIRRKENEAEQEQIRKMKSSTKR